MSNSCVLVGVIVRGAAGLRVEAHDASGECPDLIDVARTDARGAFTMAVDRRAVERLLRARKPALAFRIFDGDKLLGQAKPATWVLARRSDQVTITLERAGDHARVAVKPAPSVVRGTVRRGDGEPAPKVTVRAYDRRLGAKGIEDAPLGETTTDADGQYELAYTVAAPQLKANLVVVAGGAVRPRIATTTPTAPPTPVLAPVTPRPAATSKPIDTAESPVLANAPTTAVVDLGLDGVARPRLSQHRRMTAKLASALPDPKALADLGGAALALAAQTAGITTRRAEQLAQAAQLAKRTGGTIDPEIWFGLARAGRGTSLEQLADATPGATRDAITRAIDQGLVTRTHAPHVDELVGKVHAAAVDQIFAAKDGTRGETPIHHALAASKAPDAVRRAFVTRWLDRAGDPTAFWAAVRADKALAPHADDLELTLRIDQLVDGFTPAITELRALRDRGEVTSLRALARWQDDAWAGLVGRTGVPRATGDKPTAEESDAYARMLRRRIRDVFPTEYLRGRAQVARPALATARVAALAAANPDLDLAQALPDEIDWGTLAETERDAARAEWAAFQREARTFRHADPSDLLADVAAGKGANALRATTARVLAGPAAALDLEHTSVDEFLTASPRALDDVPEAQRPAVVGHLKAMQRLVRLGASPEAVEPLLADGLDSALRVARTPRGAFVERYADALGGEAAAERAHRAGVRAAATAQLAITTVVQSVGDRSLWGVNGGDAHTLRPDYGAALGLLQSVASAESTATWPVLFGTDAWCDCDECQSAYGPAAYFVDLLHTIDQGPGTTPADRLFVRRPDLQHLKLTCDNTNTPIPYIDLVNEILETYIFRRKFPNLISRLSNDSTGRTAAELRAVPQNVIPQVYGLLANEVYPFTLPFHRPLAVVRTYLAQLGTTYRDVIEAFGPREGVVEGLTHAQHLAAEELGLSRRQYGLIAGMDDLSPPVDLRACYGFTSGASWETTLAKVPELLRRTGLSYAELYRITHTYFLGKGDTATQGLNLQDPIECQIDNTQLQLATTETWDRLHRFVRLWRATGWTIDEVDRALFAVDKLPGSGVGLERQSLRRFGVAKRVRELLGRPLDEVLTLWAHIDTWGEHSLYLRTFQNRTVSRAEDASKFALSTASFDPQRPDDLKPTVAQLATNDEKLIDHVPTLLAALRISTNDLDAIMEREHVLGRMEAREIAPLDVGNLSALYRYTVLARGLGLRIPELVELLRLLASDPFAPADPAKTLDFIERVREIQRSGTPVATLAYVYRHLTTPGYGPVPSPSVVLDALLKVWSALRVVRQDTAVHDEPDPTLLATRLAQLHPPIVIGRIFDALDPAGGLPAARRAQILADHLGPMLGGAEQEVLAAADPDPQDAIALAARAMANQMAILRLVSAWLCRSLSEAAVVAELARGLGTSDAITRRLLVEWLPGDTGSALDTLLALAGGGLTQTTFSEPALGGVATVRGAATVALRTPAYRGPSAAGEAHGARWTGLLLPVGEGAHVLVVRSDGAVTVTVAGVAQTFPPSAGVTDRELPIAFTAGSLVPIEVTYDGGDAGGSCELLWRLATAPAAAPIAPEYLFPAGGVTALDVDGSGPGYVWRRAHKAAVIITGLGLTEGELAYAESADAPFADFRLRELPMTPPTSAQLRAHVARWQRLAAFVAVRRGLPRTDLPLASMLSAGPELGADPHAAWVERICAATGWDVATVASLLDAQTIADAEWATLSPTAIVNRLLSTVAGEAPDGGPDIGRGLAALARCADLIKRIGVDAARLRDWTKPEPDAKAAEDVVRAVRSRYTEDADWFVVAQQRNDELRQRQRDALVAHLMPQITVGGKPAIDEESLFEHFLIDVEMCACGLTSRVKQAISTVQLFIQRILLGIEPPIPPNAIDADAWAWSSRFRVWQANRKIFLYPENWIDPELRVERTPFFEELQDTLRQSPLDDASVESAFEGYLDQLAHVSRLQVCAMHWERETASSFATTEPNEPIDRLHIVARTIGAHPTYHYRTLLDVGAGGGGTEWSPWTRIDVDIQGDGATGDVHMLLAVRNRRLYLMWATFTEVPEPTQAVNDPEAPPPAALTHWEIRLAWSTFRNGAWSSKQVASHYVRSNRYITQEEAGAYPDDIAAYEEELDDAKDDLAAAEHQRDFYRQRALQDVQALHTSVSDNFERVLDRLLHHDELTRASEFSIVYGGLFPSNLESYEELSAFTNWLDDANTTPGQWLEDVFDFQLSLMDELSTLDPLTPTKDQVAGLFADLAEAQAKVDELTTAVAELVAAHDSFEANEGVLPIPRRTERRDHAFWLATDNRLTVKVIRHEGTTRARTLGQFLLDDDGRSFLAPPTSGAAVDVNVESPRGAASRVNQFQLNGGGLDFAGINNLVGSAGGAYLAHERWIHHAISPSSPRPFTIARDSDVHIALPDRVPPADSSTSGFSFKPRGGSSSSSRSSSTRRTITNRSSTETPRGDRDADSGARAGFVGVGQMTFEVDTAWRRDFGLRQIPPNWTTQNLGKLYRFEPLHHPYVHRFHAALAKRGVAGLLNFWTQHPFDADHGAAGGHFDDLFAPSRDFVSQPFSPHDIDFRAHGPYAQYNWELFFHAPHLIAARLRQDGRHAEARRWLHYIFDPTSTSGAEVPDRFWNLQVFRDQPAAKSASELMRALAQGQPSELVASIKAQIAQWHRHPAEPHRIAALRPAAYQKAIVFAYLDNLIAWGDQLFAQNTIETINEATQLYVLAKHLLGPRPERLPQRPEVDPFTYADLRGGLDEMSNMLAEVETSMQVGPIAQLTDMSAEVHTLLGISHLPVLARGDEKKKKKKKDSIRPLVFCVPANAKLLEYFDTIDDRLFKIRNCMNLAGVVQQLPLFEPPIDPALLVRAAAAGLDIASILSDLGAPLPAYRFTSVIQRANALAAKVESLGAHLLAALEKRDAESLTLLRAGHDRALARAVRETRAQQVAEATATKRGLEKSREMVEARHDFYSSREYMNSAEATQIGLLTESALLQLAGSLISQVGASASFAMPDADVGPTGMGAHGTVKTGGTSAGNVATSVSAGMSMLSAVLSSGAAMAGILGGYDRRKDEWELQTKLAAKELVYIDQQLVAADIRIAVAEHELAIQEQQVANSEEIEETLRTKYTNRELYSWMVTQLSTTYYQAYKLAYDLAKRAERCFRYELGLPASSYIQTGYWDNLRKGLLAGEQLGVDLQRLEAAYLDTARRDYELVRQISLVLHDPTAFMKLRETGACEVELPEALFDADYPGHYFRRLKSVGLTVPCVAGPYTPINCTLTLLASNVRVSSSATGAYPNQDGPNDPRFSYDYGAIASVATSHGQNDAGLFTLDFRDERYLPFEGAGAISRWRIELPKDTNGFDFDGLSDLVMRVSYTAREGGGPLAAAARRALAERRAAVPDGGTAPLVRMFRVRYEFGDAWTMFRNALADGDATLSLAIDADRFPYLYRGHALTVASVRVLATMAAAGAEPFDLQLTAPDGTTAAVHLAPSLADPTLLVAESGVTTSSPVGAAPWTIAAPAGSPAGGVRDLILLVGYTVTAPG